MLVDGIHRDHCALQVLDKLRPGGFIVIDNANSNLPSATRSPYSRTFPDGPKGETWSRFARTIEAWRTIWTTSG